MVYVILLLNLVVFGLLAVFIIRFVRSSPEARRAVLRPTKRSVLIVVSVFGLVIAGIITLLVLTFGVAGFRVSNAAKRHLESQYGVASSWSIQLSNHIERSENPKSGSYHISYVYGTQTGAMDADYFELDGQFRVEFRNQK